MDDAGVPSAGVDRDVLFFLDYRDPSLVLVGYPVADAGAQDSAPDDGYIPRLQSSFAPSSPLDLFPIFALCKKSLENHYQNKTRFCVAGTTNGENHPVFVCTVEINRKEIRLNVC